VHLDLARSVVRAIHTEAAPCVLALGEGQPPSGSTNSGADLSIKHMKSESVVGIVDGGRQAVGWVADIEVAGGGGADWFCFEFGKGILVYCDAVVAAAGTVQVWGNSRRARYLSESETATIRPGAAVAGKRLWGQEAELRFGSSASRPIPAPIAEERRAERDLSFSIALDKPAYSCGELILVALTLRNTSKETVRAREPSPRGYMATLKVKRAAERPQDAWAFEETGMVGARWPVRTVDLKPGDTVQVMDEIQRRFRGELGPGEFTVWYEYHFSEPGSSGYAENTITSNKVVIAIEPPEGEQAKIWDSLRAAKGEKSPEKRTEALKQLVVQYPEATCRVWILEELARSSTRVKDWGTVRDVCRRLREGKRITESYRRTLWYREGLACLFAGDPKAAISALEKCGLPHARKWLATARRQMTKP